MDKSDTGTTQDVSSSGSFMIGKNSAANNRYFTGRIDEPKIFNYARSAAQVLADYNSRSNPEGLAGILGASKDNQPAALSNGLVGYWKMDESSGNLTDSSGNGTTLTNNNTTAYAAGKFGNGGSFTAASSHYFSTASTISSVQTVAFWVNPTANSDEYVNLTSSAYITSSSGTVSATGFTSPSIYVNGTMDEARVYNRVLSPAEVTQLYNFAPGPVGYWKMDENTGTSAFDASGNANTGTLTGGPTWKPGKYGASVSFDGSDDYVTMGTVTSAQFTNSNPFTISTWIKVSDLNTISQIVSYAASGGQGWYMGYDGTGVVCTNCVFADYYDGSNHHRVKTSNNSISSTSTWYHLVYTNDGANTQAGRYVYLNGVDSTTRSGSGTPSSVNYSGLSLQLGARGGATFFTGQIDDVKIYNYARTAGQIIEDMNAGHPAVGSPVASSVAHWKMDEGYSTTANDSTGNSNSLTLSSASWTDSGKFNKAWNGTNTVWLSRADDSDLDFAASDSFTISGWFKSDSASNPAATEYIASKGPTSAAGYAIYANTDGTICFGIDDDATWNPDVASCTTGDFYDGSWHQVVAIRNVTADTNYLFIDGIQRDSDTDSTSATLENSATFYLGDVDGTDNGSEFAGDLDEFKVYRFALTASQVPIDMNRGAAQVLGALSDNSTYQKSAANQEYCIPGDSTSCAAPVGRWDFEEGTGTSANDTSGNANTGTLTSGPTWSTGKVGKALSFDGSDDYVDMGDVNSVEGITGLTVSMWLYADTLSGTQVANRPVTKEDSWYFFNLNGSTITFVPHGEDGATLGADASLSTGVWTHITATFDSGTYKIYKNGVLQESVTEDTTILATSAFNLSIGARNDAGTTWGNFWDGKIDQVRIYNYARSAAQVAWDYNRGAPVGHWKFDECQGTTANDSSGNSNTGTITIGASGTQTAVGTCTGSANTAWKDGVTGKLNYSLDFDGTDDYVSIADPSSGILDPGTNDFSISAWIKFPLSGSSVWDGVITKGFTTSAPANTWGLVTGNPVTDIVYQDATNAGGAWNVTVAFNGTTLSSGFHLVTLTRSGTSYIMYIDGISRATGTGLATVNLANSSALQFANADSRYFGNQIDDARVYNYALTPVQVKTLYTNGAVNFAPTTGVP